MADTANLRDYFDGLTPVARACVLAATPDEFCDAVEVALESAIQHMESGARFYMTDDERKLTHTLVGCLGTCVQVINEGYSNGHVDVTVVHSCRPAWRKLGECKIYRGPAYHIAGCSQLLGRYVTGRLPRAFCLDFVQEADIAGKFQGVREGVDADTTLNRLAPSTAHPSIQWAFLSRHGHASGEEIRLLHLGCNLYWNGTAV